MIIKGKYILFLFGIILCIINYTQSGITPIMLKYLQNINVQSLSVTAISNLLIVALYLPRILYLFYKYKFTVIKKIMNNSSSLYLLIIITISILIRSTLGLYAIKFTKSIYYQIINLTSPFFMIVLSYIACYVFKKLQNNKYKNILKTNINPLMILMIFITIIGSYVTIISLQDPDKSIFKWTINFNIFKNNNFGFYDIVGLSLMLSSMIFINIYNICVKLLIDKEQIIKSNSSEKQITLPNDKYNQNNIDQQAIVLNDTEQLLNQINEDNINLENNEIIKHEQLISNEMMFIYHIILYSIFYSIIGIIFEDWSYMLSGNWIMYLLIIIYALISYFLGNVIYFLALSFTNTTTFSLFTSVSLISNISFAGIFIPDERISNIWTILGSIIIIISITCFVIIRLKIN